MHFSIEIFFLKKNIYRKNYEMLEKFQKPFGLISNISYFFHTIINENFFKMWVETENKAFKFK